MPDAKSRLRHRLNRRHVLQGGLGAGIAAALPYASRAAGATSSFVLQRDGGAITSLRRRDDAFDTDYIAPDQALSQPLGHVAVSYRRDGGAWTTFNTATATPDPGSDDMAYSVDGLRIESALSDAGDRLDWTVTVRNIGATPVEIGDLALPLPMHTQFKADQPATAAVLKHSFVSGHGSFLFWMRSNSAGPYLVMTPSAGTHLEYWQDQPLSPHGRGIYCAYIHSAAAGAIAAAKGCQWRQPHTQLTLAPAGAPGDHQTYGFSFSWADDYDDVRRHIVAAGLIDIHVAHGMTVPSDLSTQIALQSHDVLHGLDAEYPEATTIEYLGLRGDRHIYRLAFARLGENRITIRHGDNRTTHLEFFATEPVETLIKKRGAFIAAHQHRDPAKWYNGLFGEWNMQSQTLLGPDNYDQIKGWRIYEVTCDDPGLSKPAFLASKNAEFPVQAEVTALDDYIEHFVWGGLQRTTGETYSYSIYGIPDWKTLRDSRDPGPKGRMHIWRAYDYPHIIALYFAMYRTARDHPQITTRLTAAAYLERAAGTVLALFTIPLATGNWSAYETGFYNEIIIPSLIDALDEAGMLEQARALRGQWERKVAYFVAGGANLFGSEYAFDSTGFESTQALARYALDHPHTSGTTPAAARAFSLTQMKANLFCRGVIEPAYYYLGSDYRGQAGDAFTLTYMAQMGGGAVLDYGLQDAPKEADPHSYLRLGQASLLSAWALLNSGTPESGYGYWYPGLANDGGAGGGFEPAAYGETWLGQPHHRGSWYYACEIDLGFCCYLRSAATILADDPIFGRICHGGDWQETPDGVAVVPRDGVRRRFHLRLDERRVDMVLDRDRFAAGQAIVVGQDGKIHFHIESDNPVGHTTMLTIDNRRVPLVITAGQGTFVL